MVIHFFIMNEQDIKQYADDLDDFDLFLLMRSLVVDRKLEYSEVEDVHQNPTHTAKLAVIRTIFDG